MVDVAKVDLEKLGMTKEEFEAADETEQQRLLEKAPLPAQESESEKQIKGLLDDLKKERARRSEAQQRTDDLEVRIEELEGRLEEAAKKREKSLVKMMGTCLQKERQRSSWVRSCPREKMRLRNDSLVLWRCLMRTG